MTLEGDIQLAKDIEKLHGLQEALRQFNKSCDICIGTACPFYNFCEKKDIWFKVLSKRLDNE